MRTSDRLAWAATMAAITGEPVVEFGSSFNVHPAESLLTCDEQAQSHPEPFLSFIDLVEAYLEGREELAGAE